MRFFSSSCTKFVPQASKNFSSIWVSHDLNAISFSLHRSYQGQLKQIKKKLSDDLMCSPYPVDYRYCPAEKTMTLSGFVDLRMEAGLLFQQLRRKDPGFLEELDALEYDFKSYSDQLIEEGEEPDAFRFAIMASDCMEHLAETELRKKYFIVQQLRSQGYQHMIQRPLEKAENHHLLSAKASEHISRELILLIAKNRNKMSIHEPSLVPDPGFNHLVVP